MDPIPAEKKKPRERSSEEYHRKRSGLVREERGIELKGGQDLWNLARVLWIEEVDTCRFHFEDFPDNRLTFSLSLSLFLALYPTKL